MVFRYAACVLIASLVLAGFPSAAGADEASDNFDRGAAAYTAKDYRRAFLYFELAARDGHKGGQAALGFVYEAGRGVPKDDEKAAYWFRKAADQGQRTAKFRLGRLYELGRGVAQNYADAVRWYREAAEQGQVEAQAQLGFLYSKGRGVSRDYAEALRWYRKAADQGHVDGANGAAWYLATTRDEKLRDGPAARRYAEQAVKKTPDDSSRVDTLAAAQAAAGDFAAAVETQMRALQMAQRKGLNNLEGYGKRLDLYKSGRALYCPDPACD
jgi:TPR repeat protein